MIVKVSRDALNQALDRVAKIVGRRTTIPILANLLLRWSGDSLTIVATDLNIEACATIVAEVEGSGGTTVAADALTQFARRLTAASTVALDDDAEAGRLVLKAGRAKAALPTLPSEDFPALATGDLTHRFTLAAADVVRALDAVSLAMSTEATRYYLNGVFLHTLDVEGESKLRFVATNGHILSRFELAAPRIDGMPGVIVPAKAIAEIKRLAKGRSQINFALSVTKLHVDFGGEDQLTLTTKLIDGTYPDYQRVIPAAGDKRVTLDSDALVEAVGRVTSIGGGTGDERRAVRCDFNAGRLALSMTHTDSGMAADEMDVDYDGASIAIGFNGDYLTGLVAALACDRLLCEMTEPGGPVVLRSAAGGATLCVIMPRRV